MLGRERHEGFELVRREHLLHREPRDLERRVELRQLRLALPHAARALDCERAQERHGLEECDLVRAHIPWLVRVDRKHKSAAHLVLRGEGQHHHDVVVALARLAAIARKCPIGLGVLDHDRAAVPQHRGDGTGRQRPAVDRAGRAREERIIARQQHGVALRLVDDHHAGARPAGALAHGHHQQVQDLAELAAGADHVGDLAEAANAFAESFRHLRGRRPSTRPMKGPPLRLTVNVGARRGRCGSDCQRA